VLRRALLAVGLVLMVINRVSGLVLPASTKYLVDDIIGKRHFRMLYPLVGVVLAALIAGAIFLRSYKAHAITEKDSIFIADFVNTTNDPVFDGTLKKALAVDLEQSPYLNVFSDAKARHTLTLMGKPADERLTVETAREICQRNGVKALLAGSIASLGNQYVVTLDAINAATGDTVSELQGQADSKEQVLKTLDTVTTQLRGKLGESLASIQKFDKPLELATTPSIEALKAYSEGEKISKTGGDAQAIPYYKRAIELDSNFASAWVSLGVRYSNLGENGLSNDAFSKAFQLRDHVSDRERFRIESAYYMFVLGDLNRARQTFDLYSQAYPRDSRPWLNRGIISIVYGRYEDAIRETREAGRIDPDTAVSYGNLAEDYIFTNQLDQAKSTFDDASARKLVSSDLLRGRYGLAFLRNDTASMAQLVAQAPQVSAAEDMLLSTASDTEAYYGRLSKARDLSRQAVAFALREDRKETAALWQLRPKGRLRPNAEIRKAARRRHPCACARAAPSSASGNRRNELTNGLIRSGCVSGAMCPPAAISL